jgi:hypothetical protein
VSRDRSIEWLLQRVGPQEPVLARGRAYEPIWVDNDFEPGRVAAGGPGWRLIVTDRRLLWAPSSDDPKRLAAWTRELFFDVVTSYLEVIQGHRYGIVLHHPSIDRLMHVPRRIRDFWVPGELTDVRPVAWSALAFSRADTEAARTIRDQLLGREVVGTFVEVPTRPRPHRRAQAILRSDGLDP